MPGILVAGDGAGIGGAAAAVLSGRIAALALAGGETTALRVEHGRQLAARPLLDALFPAASDAPGRHHIGLPLRGSHRRGRPAGRRGGCQGMNQLKAYTRCGMGPCQGRICGPVAIEVLAEASGVPVPPSNRCAHGFRPSRSPSGTGGPVGHPLTRRGLKLALS